MLNDAIDAEMDVLKNTLLDLSNKPKSFDADEKVYFKRIKGSLIVTLVVNGFRKYVPKRDVEKVVKPIVEAQRDRLVLECARKRLEILVRFKKELASCEISEACNGMHPESLRFIEPVPKMDDLAVKQWEQEEPYLINDIPGRKYKTDRGEMVRSKSEVLIANRLFHNGVPYRYEFPVWTGKRTVFPDFIVLNRRTGKEYLLEHLGQMDKPEYRTKNLPKLEMYAEGGHLLGTDLLLTFESDEYPLNMKLLDCYIGELFK